MNIHNPVYRHGKCIIQAPTCDQLEESDVADMGGVGVDSVLHPPHFIPKKSAQNAVFISQEARG